MIIPSNDKIEESVLLIGGLGAQSGNLTPRHHMLKNVFKYNGRWSSIGQLKKPRRSHSAIYWNGAVFVIGGTAKHNDNLKTEIWNITARVYEVKAMFYRYRSDDLVKLKLFFYSTQVSRRLK